MVSRLTRTRYGIVSLPPQLKRGQTVELERSALDALLSAAGLTSDGRSAEPPIRGDAPGSSDVDDGPPRRAEADDEAYEHAQDEVDGNRGTYGIQEPVEVLDEIDGNRAPPPQVAREARPPGAGAGRGRHKQAKNTHPRHLGAQPLAAPQPVGAQQPGRPNGGPGNKSGRRGRRGGRGGRGGQNGPGQGRQV
jgi:23S rRNA pseudouridine2605 synthase